MKKIFILTSTVSSAMHAHEILGVVALGAAFLSVGASTASAGPQGHAGGSLFVASNDAQANAVIAFERDPAGKLAPQGTYPTGGAGTGTGLGNQGALALDRPGTFLVVVNAGSDSVSSFAILPKGLELRGVAGSGGIQPISVAISGDLVYVLNEGGGGNVAGLQLSPSGQLSSLVGSERPLSVQGPDPAQVGFTPDGRFLVVTEKDTNSIVTYAIGSDGLAGAPVVTPSAGVTPFGFSFDHQSRLLVSEAAGGGQGASTVSSYDILPDGTVKPVTAALATTQSAACWLITSGDGRFAYVTNTGSDTVTGLSIARGGALSLLSPTGVTATTGAGPIDADGSRNGRFLYILNGTDATIQAYRVGATGDLSPLEVEGGLPASVNGLVVL
jgi:6-phosphogluconolactonase